MKKHPILNLFCNEDGTHITLDGKKVNIFETRKKTGELQRRSVNFRNRSHVVAKVVCECYHGMRDSKELVPVRKDGDINNDHYTNLFWAERTAFGKKIKLSDAQKEEVIAMRKDKMKLQKIADTFQVSINTIKRTLKKHRENTTES